MRFGIDAHLVKSHPTGVGKSILRTVEAMARLAPDDHFIVYANREFPDVLDGFPNCTVIRTPLIARSRVLRVLDERIFMPRRVERNRLDAFYAPGYVFPARLPAPMLLGIFDLNALKFPRLVRAETAAYYRRAVPRSAERAALVVVPTHAVARDVETILRLPPERIRVVPLGVDDRFREPVGDRAAVARKYAIPIPYILFVGNIEPNKNLVRLVEAFWAARVNRNLAHSLVIAGKRRHRAAELARRIRQLGCEEAVLFPGYVPDDDLPGLHAGADVFVYPSVAEGFGIPPLEAMACGTPVITSDDPAVVEVTGDAALHFAAANLEAFRSAIERVLTDRALAADLSRRGPTTAARYNWTETARRTLDLLREVARTEPEAGNRKPETNPGHKSTAT